MTASPFLVDIDSLLAPFQEAEKPRERFRVGTESEKLGVRADGTPIQYEGEDGVRRVLELLSERYGWSPLAEFEGGPLLALARDGASITLEPGAQLEISGAPLSTIHETRAELETHQREIRAVGRELGVRFVGLGFHPTARQEDLPWVPKLRYPIMRDYLPTRGPAAHDMMRRTCTVQANLDFESEEDALLKLKVALRLQPIVTAMFANSPFREGTVHGKRSERAEVWLHMDPDRSGIPALAFSEARTYREYVEYALDVPMFIVKRGAKIASATHLTFREFMAEGMGGERATLADWEMHIASLFPEARLKRVIEMRGVDGQTLPLALASSAFFKGLFYDPKSLEAALLVSERLGEAELAAARPWVAQLGLAAMLEGRRMAGWAEELLDLAAAGLARAAELDESGRDETIYLEPIASLVEQGICPADALLSEIPPPGSAGFISALLDAREF
jgi:glutamate--cysteine ligase